MIFKFLAHLRDLRVVYGYLALFGIVLSTVSAHRFDGFRPAAALPPKRESRRVYASRRDPEDLSAPEPGEISASYSRFSSDLQRDESITGQQLKCREFAIPSGHYIAPELEFADYAISGTKRDRVGLDQVREAARQGAFKNIYFYNLARLARESVIAMPFLKELVHVYKIRIISVTEGLDSARQGWAMLATLLCMQHERYIQDLSDSVLRGQQTTVRASYSVGDFNFGYTSVPDPNGAVVGRGRNTKPRMIYAIDPTASVWVQRIFLWFAIEKRSLSSIVRELNRHGVPKDHRSTVPAWTQQHLLTLLKNPKYVGVWPWGGEAKCS